MRAGDRVRVASGPLAGDAGTVQWIRGGWGYVPLAVSVYLDGVSKARLDAGAYYAGTLLLASSLEPAERASEGGR